MHSVKVLSALVALGASLVSADVNCKKPYIVKENNPVIDCKVFDSDITIDESLGGEVVIDGIEEITGSFKVTNATQLIGISSNTIMTIGKTFELNDLNLLSKLDFQKLRSIKEISLIKLPLLVGLTFGTTGVTKVTSIRVSDTRIADLSGLNVATVEDFQIDNNPRLNKFNSDLVNITGTLIINNNGNANGNQMSISMEKLETASELQISNVKSFDAPALSQIEKSLKFDKNPELKKFSADNLTEIGESLTFINNKKLANISFEALTKISGDLTVQNNTALEVLEGFPELKSVFGGILLAGSFESVKLPKLEDVQGTAKATSTTDISDFCDFFDDAKKSDKIHGDEKCTSNNDDALEGGDGGEESDGSGSSGSGDSQGSEDDGDAAGIVGVNMAMLGLAALAGLAQLF